MGAIALACVRKKSPLLTMKSSLVVRLEIHFVEPEDANVVVNLRRVLINAFAPVGCFCLAFPFGCLLVLFYTSLPDHGQRFHHC